MKRGFLFLLALALAPLAGAAPTHYSPDLLVENLAKDLTGHFQLDGQLQLELLRMWAAPDAPADQWALEVAEYPAQPAANMLVRVRLRADGKLVADTALLLHAALWKDAWYARLPVPNGITFDPTLLESRRTDVFRDRDALPAKEGDSNSIFARQISPGQLVTWHDLTRRPLVHRGQVVSVTANEGRLSVTMKALAMENGARGDLVTVRNMESRKDIPAIVIGDEKVEVHF